MIEWYTTGTGQRLVTHEKQASCEMYGCVIHNPTDPHQDWPTHWRDDRGFMERICPCGVGHPDKDTIAYIARERGADFAKGFSVHGCCGGGCCGLDL